MTTGSRWPFPGGNPRVAQAPTSERIARFGR